MVKYEALRFLCPTVHSKRCTCSNLIFTVKSPANKSSRMSLWTEEKKKRNQEKTWFTESREYQYSTVYYRCSGGTIYKPHMSMAQQTRIRKWNRSWSENRVSQMRMTSGRRNSCDNKRVSQRNVKYCGLMFCSPCIDRTHEEKLNQSFNQHNICY